MEQNPGSYLHAVSRNPGGTFESVDVVDVITTAPVKMPRNIGLDPAFAHTLQRIRFLLRYYDEKVRGFPSERERFHRLIGRPLNLRQPEAFTDKLVRKKLFDRNPLLPATASKVEAREFVRTCPSLSRAGSILIPIIHVARRVDQAFLGKLTDRCVVKVAHGSGMNVFCTQRDRIDPAWLRRRLTRWQARAFGLTSLQWCYQPVERLLLIESMLDGAPTTPPIDYKFYMIHGQCALIRVFHGRHRTLCATSYDADWTPLDVSINRLSGGPIDPPPTTLDRMMEIAQALSRPFDFVRVDLYSVLNSVYFGELTHYPTAGLQVIYPPKVDFELGERWHT